MQTFKSGNRKTKWGAVDRTIEQTRGEFLIPRPHPVSLHNVLAALQAAGFQPRPGGTGYRAQCPGYGHHREDQGLNLSVSYLANTDGSGRVFLRCWSLGCDEDELLDTLELDVDDLRDKPAGRRRKAMV